MPIEYLDPAIAGEGLSANNWVPGAWTNDPGLGEEWQPDIEAPRINDYAAFKKHKHYGKYFRPYRYVPFPAWLYHPTIEAKIVQNEAEVIALGPEWRRQPFALKIDMTGKALPVKTDTQRLAEAITAGLAGKQTGPDSMIDPTTIAAIVAAVMAATQAQMQPAASVAAVPVSEGDPDSENSHVESTPSVSVERAAMIELAERENVKIDKRWSDERIKRELGL
jgi:hypothetical protein